jgi:hypothetical protein
MLLTLEQEANVNQKHSRTGENVCLTVVLVYDIHVQLIFV